MNANRTSTAPKDRSAGIKPLFIIGAQKAGTSYLFRLLTQDPTVARAEKKEPKFFSKPRFDSADFLSVFEIGSHHRFALDASVSYLHVQGTAEQIAVRVGTDPPIIAVLRDPVERAISAYLHEVKHGRELRLPKDVFDLRADSSQRLIAEENARLEEACRIGLVQPHGNTDDRYRDELFQFRYVANSLYGLQLEPFLNLFANVRLVDFKFLKTAPDATVERLRAAVGLTTGIPTQYDVEVNATRTSFLSAFRENRALAYRRRPAALFVVLRLAKTLRQVPRLASQFPETLARIMRKEFDALVLRTSPLWT